MLTDEDLEYIFQSTIESPDLITVIQAPTGTGKTQLIPPYLHRKSKLKVFVAVPTREAARASALRVSKFNSDISVGYAAGGKSRYNSTTSLVYATSGHIKNVILTSFNRYGVSNIGNFYLILDEYHVESVDNTIIMNLWKEAKEKHVTVPRLIFLSATHVNIKDFTDRVIINIPIKGKKFDVKTKYLEKQAKGDKVYDEMYKIASELPTNSGHVLLFVPTIRIANKLAGKIRDNLKVFTTALHSKTSDEDTLRAFKPLSKREFIVATNVMESSITINGLGVVIDSMREKVAYTSGNGGKMLREGFITEQSSIQRKGRTGRTRDGIYYAMIPEKKELDKQKVAEYLRIPIYDEILELIIQGISDPRKIFPDYTKMDGIYRHLAKYGAVSKDLSTVEILGYFAASSRLSLPMSRFLWEWMKSGGSTYWGVVISAIIDTDLSGLFIIPFNLQNSSTDYVKYLKDNFSRYYTVEQLGTVLNVWADLELATNGSLGKKIEKDYENVFKWCDGKNINPNVLVLITETIMRTLAGIERFLQQDRVINDLVIAEQVRSLNINLNQVSKTSVAELMMKCTPIFYRVFSDRVIIARGNKYYDQRRNEFIISRDIPCKTIDRSLPLIALNDVKNENLHIATIVIYTVASERMYDIPKPDVEIDYPDFWTHPKSESFDVIFPDFDVISPEEIGFPELEVPTQLIPASLTNISALRVPKSNIGESFLGIPMDIMFPVQTSYNPPTWMTSIIQVPSGVTGIRQIKDRKAYESTSAEDIPVSFMVIDETRDIDIDKGILEQYID